MTELVRLDSLSVNPYNPQMVEQQLSLHLHSAAMRIILCAGCGHYDLS